MNFQSIILISFLLFELVAKYAHAEEKHIYQTDSIGNIQYNKPSFAIQNNGRIIETDPVGNKRYDKQQYQIKGDKVYQVDPSGNTQYHKPKLLDK